MENKFKLTLKKFHKIAVKLNIYLVISVIFAVIVFYFSVIPETQIGPARNSGFLAHFVSYSALSLLLLFCLIGKKLHNPAFKAALLVGSYGFFIELVQLLIPYRNFEFTDIIINYAAAFTIFFVYILFTKS